MKTARAIGLALMVAMMVLVSARTASAAPSVEIRADVEPASVEVGDVLTYSLHVLVRGGGTASDARPGNASGFTMQGTRSMPVHMFSNNNGVVDDVNSLTTSWSLRADRIGTFSLGPAEAAVHGVRYRAPAVRVKVVARGKASPQRGATAPVDPFASPLAPSPLDPFRSLFDFGDDDRRSSQAAPPTDPKLALDAPRGPVAFLHAAVDKTRAVVGEQVTLSVYLYEDPYARQGQPTDVHEATATDFVKRSLLEDETHVVGAGTALVGGSVWNVKLVRKNALFPLKKGHLTIDPMSLTFPHMRHGLRESETLHVDVVDPPASGRPAGYALGDVGDLSLQATVAPRSIPQGGAIGVTVELRGSGNFPGRLALPVSPGVEWLEPQTQDKLGPMSADRYGGTRAFSYVVRIQNAGSINLGEIKLPLYDADKRAYRTARATLGIVNVTPGEPRDAGVEEKEVVLGNMPKARSSLEGLRAETYLAERSAYWVLLFGMPLAGVLGIGAGSALGRLRQRRERAAPSPDRVARERREEADRAVRAADGKAAMGAIARAIEALVLAKTGVNVRGTRAETAKAELVAAGTDEGDVDGILSALRACEDARFSPDGVDASAARDTWDKARPLLDRLRRST